MTQTLAGREMSKATYTIAQNIVVEAVYERFMAHGSLKCALKHLQKPSKAV